VGFLCKTKENKYLDNPFDRDIGLSNIYNINSVTNFCFEPFNGPTYNLSGATKAITGATSPCSGTPTNCYAVYNLSEVDSFDLTFNFTGSTEYTGYTGSFCYKIFDRKDFTLNIANKGLNNVDAVYEKCFDFSAITSTTITENLAIGEIPFTNTDYLLRNYYKFIPKECGTNEIDTWVTSPQLNNFNYDFDWYFLTIKNPPTPVITTTFGDVINNVTLIQETIPTNNYENNFVLSNQPIDNKVNLYVNGVRLTENVDYTLDTSQFPRTYPVVKILTADIEVRDVITVVYLVGPQSFVTELGQLKNDLFEIDTFSVTGFTSGVTASTINIVNQNTIKGTQEVFLTNNFDPQSNIVGVLNGVTLTEDLDFYRSRTTPNKIIFNPKYMTIKVGDILSFWYFKTTLGDRNNLGTLNTDSVRIQWTVDPLPEQRYNSGIFVLDVTETSDTNWTSLFYSNSINYIESSKVYENLVDNLDVNKEYKFRITFYKTYKNLLNEDIINSSQTIGYFNTKNDKIIYGY
jgi:hypothetical protein